MQTRWVRTVGFFVAAFALFADDAKNFDYIFDGFKVIAAVAEHVYHAHDAPTLQLAEAGADVAAGDGERGGYFVGGKRARRGASHSPWAQYQSVPLTTTS